MYFDVEMYMCFFVDPLMTIEKTSHNSSQIFANVTLHSSGDCSFSSDRFCVSQGLPLIGRLRELAVNM